MIHMNFLPKYKVIHPCYEFDSGTIRLGDSFGTAVEIDDTNKSIRTLIKLLDGTKTINEIYEEIIKSYPKIQLAEVIEAIDELNDLGFLINNSLEITSELSHEQRERYKANLNYYSLFCDVHTSPSAIQKKLNETQVTIIGMGGFGNHILVNLAGMGIHNIRFIDFDTVELSNLNRQFLFHENCIGKLKIHEAQSFIKHFNSNIKTEAINKEIKSQEDVEGIISNSDIVILAADQPQMKIQRWVNTVCLEKNIPFISGGVDLTYGMFYTIIPNETGCLDCLHLYRMELAEDYLLFIQSILENDKKSPTATVFSNPQIITAMMCTELMKLITKIGDLESNGRLINIDFHTFEKSIPFEWTKNDNCLTCNHQAQTNPMFNALQNTFENHHKIHSK